MKERPVSDYEILQFFDSAHLPQELRVIGLLCAGLARSMAKDLPTSAETSAGLRKLLEAKDCFVRAKLLRFEGDDHEEPMDVLTENDLASDDRGI